MSKLATASVDRVDEDGIVARTSGEDVVVDVLFDGRRIWSFWVLRDSEPRPTAATGSSPGPSGCASSSTATPGVELRAHVDDTVLYDEEHRFGTGEDRIAIVDAQGRPVGIDNYGRLQRTFETRTADQTEPLLDAVERILDALARDRHRGVPRLRHAARRGARGPAARPRLRRRPRLRQPQDGPGRRDPRVLTCIERRLADMGYRIERYSGAGFEVLVEESDGSVRGLDVFGGFYAHGHLMVMGEIRVPFPEECGAPARHDHPRGPHAARAGRHRRVPHRDVRPALAGPGPGLRLRDAALDLPPLRRLVPRHPREPRGLGPPLPGQRRNNPRRKPPELAQLAARARGHRTCRSSTWAAAAAARRRWLAAAWRRRARPRLRADGVRVHERVGGRAAAAAAAVRDAQPARDAPRPRLGRPARARARPARAPGPARRRRGARRRAPATSGGSPRWRAAPRAGSTSSSSPARPRTTPGCSGSCCTRSTPSSWCASSRERGGTVVERQDSGPDGQGRTTCRMVVAWHG